MKQSITGSYSFDVFIIAFLPMMQYLLIRRIVKSHNALIGNVHLEEYIMAKINFIPGQDNNNKNPFHFYNGSFVNTYNAFAQALSSSTQFNTELWNAFAEAVPIYFSTISEYNKSWKDLSELDKILRNKFRKVFNQKFREERFVNTLSDTVASYSELAKTTGIGKMYQHFLTDCQDGTMIL